MGSKKFGLIIAAGILSLAACGQEEQPTADGGSEAAVAEKEKTEKEKTSAEAAEEKTEEEAVEESPPEAESGAASELLSNGDETSYVFNTAGEFSIFCEPHPVMQMTVLVEEGSEQTGKVAVDIADYAFGEKTITVAPGTTVTWTNQDQAQHNVAIK
ncbi:plastocyanin/azurin family copper-binding protein [Planomicrobium sp. CPCC 101110]|uniref:plastocyanin/azurin family copper-binding protein n=1 Tax=Planomicrobium sp. CPCC 101110 TaxID=2599619 RepID=UPI0011B67C26|nr:plastocyanin/azurin family copper-binding protein [Planomicrobium sp. CPCC 101110]TWT28131.1 hypothetical protein FQV30_06425 [Planomicrobium sp. CPCC 101110]